MKYLVVSKKCITFANEIRNDEEFFEKTRCNSVGRMLHLVTVNKRLKKMKLYIEYI